MNAVILVEELAAHIKRASWEKGWWHRLLLNSNIGSSEMNDIMSNTGNLSGLPNVAARVIFEAVNLHEE